jgi:hypothetical protein
VSWRAGAMLKTHKKTADGRSSCSCVLLFDTAISSDVTVVVTSRSKETRKPKTNSYATSLPLTLYSWLVTRVTDLRRKKSRTTCLGFTSAGDRSKYLQPERAVEQKY